MKDSSRKGRLVCGNLRMAQCPHLINVTSGLLEGLEPEVQLGTIYLVAEKGFRENKRDSGK